MTEPWELSRRRLLEGLGAVASGVVIPGCGSDARSSGGSGGTGATGGSAGTGGAGSMCVLTPEQVEGPFFIDTELARSDITEGKPGIALRVGLTIVQAPACSPIEGALVELWHTDATGAYSGFDIADGNIADTAGETFLRGNQTTDGSGIVEFNTVYPGWYPGRTPHFHVLVLLGDNRLVTTQLYFDDALTDSIYQLEPYAARGPRDTTNAQDGVSRFGGAPGTAPLELDLVESGDGYAGNFVIAVGA